MFLWVSDRKLSFFWKFFSISNEISFNKPRNSSSCRDESSIFICRQVFRPQHLIFISSSLHHTNNVRIGNSDDSAAPTKLSETKSRSTKFVAESENRNETNQPTDEADSIRIVYLFIALLFPCFMSHARKIPFTPLPQSSAPQPFLLPLNARIKLAHCLYMCDED